MTIEELRNTVFERIGVHDSAEILSDKDLILNWVQATKYWQRYMDASSGEGNPRQIGFSVDDTLMHTFTGTVPSRINALYSMPNGQTVPCWVYLYAKPVLTLFPHAGGAAGNYVALFDGSLSYEDLNPDDIPFHLLDLYAAYVKRAVGQFLKFSGYQDKPFDVDGEAWYREGKEWADKMENFIMVNRDERMSNITDFNTKNKGFF